MDRSDSSIKYNVDGYIEIIFMGVVPPARLAELMAETRQMSEEHGPVKVLIDGRNGSASRTAKGFSTLMRMGRYPNVSELIILTTKDPAKLDAIRGPGIVTSILTSVLGFRPIYTSDETEARRLAAAK